MDTIKQQEFWSRVYPTEHCWFWQGTRGGSTKGNQWYGKFGGQFAHRVMMQLQGHNIKGLIVRHSCDQPGCVRPDHLLLGSQADNNRDTRTRQRHIFGSRHPLSKLTEQDVREIKLRLQDYVPRKKPSLLQQLAVEYGVDNSKIKQIRSGRSWRHV